MAEAAGGISLGEVQALVTSLMPKPATQAPLPEATTATVGADPSIYALDGHKHPRLTSTTLATLAADGTSTVMFTRSFSNKPGVVMTEIDASATQPLIMVVQSFVQVGGLFTGCVVKGYRSQPLPSQNQLSVASLLTGVISGVNALASTLTGFNVLGGSAAGASVSVIAIARSDV